MNILTNLSSFFTYYRISAQTPDDLPEFMKAILTAAGVQYTQIIQHK